MPSTWETQSGFNTKLCPFSYYCQRSLSHPMVWAFASPLCTVFCCIYDGPTFYWMTSAYTDSIAIYHFTQIGHSIQESQFVLKYLIRNDTNKNEKILTKSWNSISIWDCSESVKQYLKITVYFLPTQNFSYFHKCTGICHKWWSRNVQFGSAIYMTNTY